MRGELEFDVKVPVERLRSTRHDPRKTQGLGLLLGVATIVLAYAASHTKPALQRIPDGPMSFGAQTSGSAGAARSLHLAMSDASTLSVHEIHVAGDRDNFTIEAKSCLGDRHPTQCTISIQFSPTSAGTKSAVLDISDTVGNHVEVALSGVGVAQPPIPPPQPPRVTTGSTDAPVSDTKNESHHTATSDSNGNKGLLLPPKPLEVRFTAEPQTGVVGQQSRLCYELENADSASIEPGFVRIEIPRGCVPVTPTETETFTLTARGVNGEVKQQQLTVTIVNPVKIVSFAARPENVKAGQEVQLCYELSQATSARIEPEPGDVPAVDSNCVKSILNADHNYTLTAFGLDGRSDTRTVQVHVLTQASISDFHSQPALVRYGESAELCYQLSRARRAAIRPAVGALQILDQSCVRVTPFQTTRYDLTAWGADGVPVTNSVDVRVIPPSATIERFWADPGVARPREQFNLCYLIKNAIEGQISSLGGIDLQQRCKSATEVETTRYVLRVRGADGRVAESEVTVPITDTKVVTPPRRNATVPDFPDLTATLDETGRAAPSGTQFQLPVRVTVRNQGKSPAGPFKVSLAVDGREPVPFTVPGQTDRAYPQASLPAGRSITFVGTALIRGPGNRTVSLTAKADSCDGDEIFTGFCRVQESNEQNNTSNAVSITLPGTVKIQRPSVTDRVIVRPSPPR